MLKNLLKKRVNKKGFTLAELLIVVAIIAVLVAIAIPVFSTQLEKSREATDAANIRAAYAEVLTESLQNPDEDCEREVTLVQTTTGWQNTGIGKIGGIDVSSLTVGSGKVVKISYKADAADDEKLSIVVTN